MSATLTRYGPETVQSGNWSGPVGSTQGQQSFADGLTVREQQPTTWGYTPHFGPVEVFGDTLRDGWVGLGCGIKQIRDPGLTQEFAADPRPLDISQPPAYAVGLAARPGRVLLDGEPIRTAEQTPDYPMQLIIGVFDFPEQPDPGGAEPDTPAITVHRVVGRPSAVSTVPPSAS